MEIGRRYGGGDMAAIVMPRAVATSQNRFLVSTTLSRQEMFSLVHSTGPTVSTAGGPVQSQSRGGLLACT